MIKTDFQREIFEKFGVERNAQSGLQGPGLQPNRLRQADLTSWPVAADWQVLVAQFVRSAPGQHLRQFLQTELRGETPIYPAEPFYALQHTALASVKVVILGQDPYHAPGQAHGLAFSVPPGVKIPPSLRNIFKEIARCAAKGPLADKSPGENSTLGASQDPLPATAFVPPASGNLDHWAAQGVLLLNTCLTVQDGHPASHAKQGWEVLTDALIQACAQKTEPVVFMLWGAHAQAKQALIAAQNANGRHLVLTANHPSPLSALRPPTPFLGCNHFENCNQFLQKNGQKMVVW